mmetsp:Transcript_20423/g.68190  ORF Transcript_20423/g.68190 Transcript_20423/m.68190 type:complete len:88 (-) Transcript_20423:2141-2404(-)
MSSLTLSAANIPTTTSHLHAMTQSYIQMIKIFIISLLSMLLLIMLLSLNLFTTQSSKHIPRVHTFLQSIKQFKTTHRTSIFTLKIIS